MKLSQYQVNFIYMVPNHNRNYIMTHFIEQTQHSSMGNHQRAKKKTPLALKNIHNALKIFGKMW